MAEDRNKLQKEYNKLLQEAKDRVRNLADAQKETLKIVEKIFQISGGQLDIFEEQVDVVDKLTKSQRENTKQIEEASKKTKSTFQKLKESTDKVKQGFKQGNVGIKQFGGNLSTAVKTGAKLSVAGIAAGGAFGALLLVGKKLLDTVVAVDEAATDLVKTSGVLDKTFSTVLIQATETSSILGGNIKLAAEAASSLFNELSVAIPLTSKLVSNTATIAEQFGIGNENAAKLTRIVSELTETSFTAASKVVGDIVDGLGKLGPAAARNLAESYEDVNDNFGIGLKSLQQQALVSTQLGTSLSRVAEIAAGLLDFQSSISAEFRASALIGQQLNLQRARQLSLEGDIVGANNEILDQVERIGDFNQLQFFQRQAIAQATGKSVSELQRELNIRRQLGVLGKVEERTRETALTSIEVLRRRLQASIFRVFASPQVQRSFEKITESLEKFFEGGTFLRIIDGLSGVVDRLGDGLLRLSDIDLSRSFLGRQVQKVIGVDDAVITPQGEVVKTNPRDFIIATQNPQQLTSGGNDIMMAEMVSLLRDLKQNGVRSEVNLDGKRVSKTLGIANRY